MISKRSKIGFELGTITTKKRTIINYFNIVIILLTFFKYI